MTDIIQEASKLTEGLNEAHTLMAEAPLCSHDPPENTPEARAACETCRWIERVEEWYQKYIHE